MNYKLLKPMNENYSALEQILTNRGIKHEDIQHYMNTTDDDVNNCILLGEEKMRNAVTQIMQTISRNESAILVVD